MMQRARRTRRSEYRGQGTRFTQPRVPSPRVVLQDLARAREDPSRAADVRPLGPANEAPRM